MFNLAILMSPPSGQQPGLISYIFPFAIIMAIMYFLMIRPQQQEQKKHAEMLNRLEKGDKIVTTGGIVGVISNIKNNKNTLIIKTVDTKLEIGRDYVSKVLPKGGEEE